MIKKPILFLSFTIFFFVFAFPLSNAFSDTGFSQLYFDKDLNKKRKNNDGQLDQIFRNNNLSKEDKEAVEGLKEILGIQTEGEEPAEKVEDEQLKTIEIPENTLFLPPSLGELEVDEENQHYITSSSSWKPKNRSCISLSNELEKCAKVSSFEEVISRFSGQNDFFEGYCDEKCDTEQFAYPIDITLDTLNVGFRFRTIAVGEQCAVRLEKERDREWQALVISNLQCACLDSACK